MFTEDTDVLLAGSQYLHTAGPAFGFIGIGMLLYFASQGAGCMLWPAVAAVMRVLLVAGAGCASLAWGAPSIRITYLAVVAAMAVFGGINVFAVTTWPR